MYASLKQWKDKKFPIAIQWDVLLSEDEHTTYSNATAGMNAIEESVLIVDEEFEIADESTSRTTVLDQCYEHPVYSFT